MPNVTPRDLTDSVVRNAAERVRRSASSLRGAKANLEQIVGQEQMEAQRQPSATNATAENVYSRSDSARNRVQTVEQELQRDTAHAQEVLQACQAARRSLELDAQRLSSGAQQISAVASARSAVQSAHQSAVQGVRTVDNWIRDLQEALNEARLPAASYASGGPNTPTQGLRGYDAYYRSPASGTYTPARTNRSYPSIDDHFHETKTRRLYAPAAGMGYLGGGLVYGGENRQYPLPCFGTAAARDVEIQRPYAPPPLSLSPRHPITDYERAVYSPREDLVRITSPFSGSRLCVRDCSRPGHFMEMDPQQALQYQGRRFRDALADDASRQRYQRIRGYLNGYNSPWLTGKYGF